MVWQKSSYFAQLAKSYPILKLADIYDRQSFIRAYVLDNIFVCIFVYALFYLALWYANKAIRRIEKTNEELLAVVNESQVKLDDLAILKKKKAEYEDVIIKVKGAQKVTAEQLEHEMKRLSMELLSASNKMNELEKIVEKMIFSTSARREAAIYRTMSELGSTRTNRTPRKGLNHVKKSKFSSRPFHHQPHRHPHPENTEFSPFDPSANQEQLPLLRCRTKSDSNSTTSTEVSLSPATDRRSLLYVDEFLSPVLDDQRDDTQEGRSPRLPRLPRFRRRLPSRRCRRRRSLRGWYRKERSSYLPRRSTICSLYGITPGSLRNLTPFTRSLLDIGKRFVNSM